MYKTVVDEAINIVTVYNDSEEIDKVLRKLMEVYNKIELNYKMGNTFYWWFSYYFYELSIENYYFLEENKLYYL